MTMDQQNLSVQQDAAHLLQPTNENNKRALQTDGEGQEHSHNKKRPMTFIASWQKKTYTMSCTPEETVEQLKLKLQGLTNVRPQNMKLLNLVKGKLPSDDTCLESLSLRRKPGSNAVEFLMLGTADANIFKDPDQVDTLPDVLNDLEYDYFPSDHPTHLDQAKVQKKLKETTEKTTIRMINPLREGKKLLVMDLDYTLFDCKSPASHISELMRPGMHSYLTSAYEHYDIVIWSQTSWRTLEAKVTELGILSHPDYKIAFVMDITTMISVTTLKADGSEFKHQVKALDIIWSKFPQFSAKNTIHVDDLSRNFALNPKCGLKISAFKHAPVKRLTDRELYYVARYLLLIVNVDDFTLLNHKRWRSYPGVLE
ncbi:HAD-like domain-containing protein [Umbelopsis sp. AD052]|nr:HAD-like domain-containing protein [Umbelopsis sp. AD052]